MVFFSGFEVAKVNPISEITFLGLQIHFKLLHLNYHTLFLGPLNLTPYDLNISAHLNLMKGIIYKIVSNDTKIEDFYVGSTFQELRCHKNEHKTQCHNKKRNNYNVKVYEFIHNNGGFDAWDLVEIEVYEFDDQQELRTRERHWIENLKPSLNSRIPCQTKKEKKQSAYVYRKQNRDRLFETFTCICRKTTSRHDFQRHRRSNVHKKRLNIVMEAEINEMVLKSKNMTSFSQNLDLLYQKTLLTLD